MRSLCLTVALMTVVIASPAIEPVKVDKRIIPGLLGSGGFLGGLLGESGLGSLLGEEGPLGTLIEGVSGLGNLAEGLVRLEEDVFRGILSTATGLADTVLGSLLGVLKSLLSGLAGKTNKQDIYAEFRKHPIDKLCKVCGSLPNADQKTACENYCRENNTASK